MVYMCLLAQKIRMKELGILLQFFFFNMVTNVKKAGKRKLEFGKSPYNYWGRGEEMGRNELAFSPS